LGPHKFLNFLSKYNKYHYFSEITLSAGGLALLGCSCSIIFVPLLSEIIDGVRDSEGVIHSGTINDKAAGVFNTAYAVGCIIAPILGGYLNMYTNFRVTCDTMAFSSLSYALIFFLVIILPGFCRRPSHNSNEIAELINTPVHLLRNHDRLSAYS
jgi:MFS family permease